MIKHRTLAQAEDSVRFLIGIEEAAIQSYRGEGRETRYLPGLLAQDKTRLAHIEKYKSLWKPQTQTPADPSLFRQLANVIQDYALGADDRIRKARLEELKGQGYSSDALTTLRSGDWFRKFHPDSAARQMLYFRIYNSFWAVDPKGEGLWVLNPFCSGEVGENDERLSDNIRYRLKSKAVFVPREVADDFGKTGQIEYFYNLPADYTDGNHVVSLQEFLSVAAKPNQGEQLREDIIKVLPPYYFD